MVSKGGSRHMKALAAPRTWAVQRKAFHFVAKPRPGAHALENSMPAYIILRDLLGEVSSIREAKRVFKESKVLIDGRPVKDEKRAVGLMDVISSPEWADSFRLAVDDKGKLFALKIPTEEVAMKISKVLSKFTSKGGRVGVRLHDGTCPHVTSELPISVGDSVVLSLPGRELKEVIQMKEGASCFVFKGRSAGKIGKFIREIPSTIKREALVELQLEDGSSISTLKDYVIAVGEQTPRVTLR